MHSAQTKPRILKSFLSFFKQAFVCIFGRYSAQEQKVHALAFCIMKIVFEKEKLSCKSFAHCIGAACACMCFLKFTIIMNYLSNIIVCPPSFAKKRVGFGALVSVGILSKLSEAKKTENGGIRTNVPVPRLNSQASLSLRPRSTCSKKLDIHYGNPVEYYCAMHLE